MFGEIIGEPGDYTSELHYTLPATPQYPRLRRRTVERQWAEVKHFLSACTDSVVERHGHGDSAQLEISTGGQFGVGSDLMAAIGHAAEAFGACEVEPCFIMDTETHQWKLTADQVPTAVALLAEGEPWDSATNWLSPVRVRVIRGFRWRDPLGGGRLAGQRPYGKLRSDTLACQLGFDMGPAGWAAGYMAFPFPEVNEACVAYLATMTPLLPFSFLPKHLRIMHPAGDGRWHGRPRRLPAEDVARIARVLEAGKRR